MKIRRSYINKILKKHIHYFWDHYSSKEVHESKIKEFLYLEEGNIQNISHLWKRDRNLIDHAHRSDIKDSLRDYVKRELVLYFGERGIIIVSGNELLPVPVAQAIEA